jgi:hypothetical protein
MNEAKNGKPVEASLKLAQNYRIISTSYHEASHVICGLLHYIRVEEVYIEEWKRSVGGATIYHTLYPDEEYDKIDPKIKEYLLMSEIYLKYAGLAGERIYFKDLSGSDNFPFVLKLGSLGKQSDMEEAAQLIKKHNLAEPGQKRYSLKNKMFRKTTNILKEYWPDIKLLAHSLYEKRKLQEEDIRQLLIKKSPNKKFWKKQFNTITSLFTSPLDNAVIMHIIDTTT